MANISKVLVKLFSNIRWTWKFLVVSHNSNRRILKYLRYVVKQIFVFCTFRRNAMFVSKCLGIFFGVKLFA